MPRIPAILESVRRFCTAKCVTIAAIGAAVCKKDLALSRRSAIFAVPNLHERVSLPPGIGYCSKTFRAFFMPGHKQPAAVISDNFCSTGRCLCSFGERDMTAVSLSIRQTTQAMKAIAIRETRTRDLSGHVRRIRGFLTSKCVTIAAIGAAVCYAGCLAGSDLTMYSGAFAALLAVRPVTEKGGEA